MRVTLVQPPNGLHDVEDLAPPLGLLTLAAVLEDEGHSVCVLDMNLKGIRDHRWFDDFYANATRWIAESNPDVVGFTSMALESHVCLELARRIKALDPGIVTVLGGPHFGSIAREVLSLFSWIDYVVVGEGEAALPALLRSLRENGTIANVARRVAGGVELTRAADFADPDSLPWPAYHLVRIADYFETNPLRLANYEPGRGCVFRCAFCYSPGHWGQRHQFKSVERVVAENARLEAMGAEYAFFVQDNFLNSKTATLEMCEALGAAPLRLPWNCYGTLPQLNEDIADALAAARCREVFVGVDAVTAEARKSFLKHFFKGWSHLRQRLEICLDRGITPTCAFMVDPPGDSSDGTDAVLNTALFARNLGCGIRLNTLTLYNGTASAEAQQGQTRSYTAIKPTIILDTPDVVQRNPYAERYPELFPFHNTSMDLQRYRRFVSGMHVAYTLFTSFPRTLLQYVVNDHGSVWGLVDDLACHIGDLTRLRPTARRPLEREVFLERFGRLTLSRPTRAALWLETAELVVKRRPAHHGRPVELCQGQTLTRLGPREVVRLPAAPEFFREAVADSAGPSRPYLVSKENDRIHWRAIDEHTAQRLEGLVA
jgi:radical SAM superfamily enzyme YgiQ (UPF0313 family)